MNYHRTPKIKNKPFPVENQLPHLTELKRMPKFRGGVSVHERRTASDFPLSRDAYEDLHPLILHEPKESSGVIPSVWEEMIKS